MKFIEADLKIIEQAISNAERKTNAELVVYIANASDSYQWAHLLFAACGAVLAGGTLMFLETRMAWPFSATQTLIAEVIGAFAASLIPWIPAAFRNLLPRRWQLNTSKRSARLLFLENGLHLTQKRNAVLIYVSLLERSIEILADAGIGAELTDFWRAEVDLLSCELKKANKRTFIPALVSAVERVGTKLAGPFPSTADDRNELPNTVRQPSHSN